MAKAVKEERRRYARHPIRVPIKLRRVNGAGSFRFQTADLSEGGFHFFSDDPISEGTVLEIEIPLGSQLFKLTGEVVYSFKEETSGLFRSGISFRRPAMAFRSKLAEEILRIHEFQKETSHKGGHFVTEEEAAREWIRLYAEKFSELYQGLTS